MIDTVLGWLFKIVNLVRHVRVRTHRAYLPPNVDCYFINVTNLSPQRDAEITHVWMASDPEVHVLNLQRQLPRRLRPEESWETWIEVDRLPENVRETAHALARVRLSTGSVIKSKRNENVPPIGSIPGS